MAIAFEANMSSDANCKSFAQPWGNKIFKSGSPVLKSEQLPFPHPYTGGWGG